MQVHPSRNYIPAVISSPNYTSLPFMAAIFLITHLMAVLQPFGYSVFHGRDTPIVKIAESELCFFLSSFLVLFSF